MNSSLAAHEFVAEVVLPLESLVDKAKYFASNGHAANTKRTYAKAWNNFIGWCEKHGTSPMAAKPIEALVGLYAADMADKLKPASLEVAVAAIRYYLRQQGIRRLD